MSRGAAANAPGMPDAACVLEDLRAWAAELGFSHLAVAHLDLAADTARLDDFLARGRHGTMAWLARHREARADPRYLVPGALSVISVRVDYMPEAPSAALAALADGERAYISRYALGRDYHKTLRGRLRQLARRLEGVIGPFGYRAFCDSAPLLERALARNAGLGWIGKHTNLIDRERGSLFFLGEILTDLALPATAPAEQASDHCGSCTRCLDACPTAAIVAPYELDARRCISYLTIESREPIPLELRRLVGNRIFGCDDCQLVCPWNRYARVATLPDFAPRHGLDARTLVDLFALDEAEFERLTEGSALRRVSFEQWLRNLAVALGNAPGSPAVLAALTARREHPSALVREHVEWALAEQRARAVGA
ncbi:MAG: tRNA epoxyqueuosine(34) reductase QueG [Gammaproteobacteria bacterium]